MTSFWSPVRRRVCRWMVRVVVLLPGVSQAIEVQPTPVRIHAALKQGKATAQAKQPPDRLYAWFGSSEENLSPEAFCMTKISGLAVLSAHFALRSEHPSDKDSQRILDERDVLISVTIWGNTPRLALDSYMVLTQGDQLIKPIRVRFDGIATRSANWPNVPGYRAKVVGSFRYEDIDPVAVTTLSVVPRDGGEISFDLDFSTIQ